MIETPHFKFPFQLAPDGTAAQITEQDSDDEIMDCIEVLLRTAKGERIELPDYGILDQTFREGGANLGHILAQIRQFEERAEVQLDADIIQDLVQNVTVAYRGGLVG